MAANNIELAPLIAIIGCDGSGKSTVSKEVLACVRLYHSAELAHLGKQSGNIGRALSRLPLVGQSIARLIVRKSDTTRAQRGKKTPGFLVALVITVFSLRRLRRFRRMMALRRKGLIIVTDRFPQLDFPGAYDGPGFSVRAPGNPIVRWLARRERRLFEWMTSYGPDLVLRLNVDLDVAYTRKPDHRRALLAKKIEATPLLKFNGAPIVEIDANQPLADVLTCTKAAVTDMLTKRGFARLKPHT